MAGIFYEGLDRSSVLSALELMAVDRGEWPEVFAGLRIMESAAKPILNKKE